MKIEEAGFPETLATICQTSRYHVPGTTIQVGFEVLTAVSVKSSRIFWDITNSVALVPERPPLVGEVSANFCG
jgi:hypothetical protein